jgi:hypothetical protein
MMTGFPIAGQVEILERRLANAEAKLARLISFGNQLSTLVHDLNQQGLLSGDKKHLIAALNGWDKARRMP